MTLPEPVAEPLLALPPESATLAESLSIAFLTMLQSLAPVERAAFLLHEIAGRSSIAPEGKCRVDGCDLQSVLQR
jgi:DNA-directed RNA polymerase specialized sigma24 family protein